MDQLLIRYDAWLLALILALLMIASWQAELWPGNNLRSRNRAVWVYPAGSVNRFRHTRSEPAEPRIDQRQPGSDRAPAVVDESNPEPGTITLFSRLEGGA
jgi:hypothetical protein